MLITGCLDSPVSVSRVRRTILPRRRTFRICFGLCEGFVLCSSSVWNDTPDSFPDCAAVGSHPGTGLSVS